MDTLLHSPERLAVLLRTGLLDSGAEASFDRISRLAAKLLRAPVALVSLVDADRQYFKSCIGLAEPWASRRETPLSHSFCQHIVNSGDPLIIEDATLHPLVSNNRAVDELGVMAYLGVPLNVDGQTLGAFCVIDGCPRSWTEDDLASLSEMAEVVLSEIRLRAERSEVETSRRDLEVTLASLDDAVISVGSSGTITLMNRVAERLCGVTATEAIGRPLASIYRVEADPSSPISTDTASLVLRPGRLERGSIQSILHSADGSSVPIEERISPIRDGGGNISGIVLVFRDISARQEAEELHQGLAERVEAQARLLDAVLSSTPDFVYVFSLDHRFTYANSALTSMYGRGEVAGKTFEELGYPQWHAAMHSREIDEVVATRSPVRGIVPFTGTFGRRVYDYIFVPVLGADGSVTAVAGITRDVTDRQRDEAVLAGQKHSLELLARGSGLSEVLESLCRLVEGQAQTGMLASILVVDRDGQRFRNGAAPSLPAAYNELTEGVALRPWVGPCCKAADLGEPIYIDDVAADPAWADFAAVALPHGIQSCWSHPILSGRGEVIGTLAMYHDHPRKPGPEDLRLVDVVTHTAAIAIERTRAEDDLREARTRLESALAAGSISTWILDVLNQRVVADERLAEIFGVSPEVAAEGKVESYLEVIHQDDRVRVAEALGRAIAEGGHFDSEYRIVQQGGPHRWVIARGVALKDETGRVVSLPGAIVDVTEQKEAEAEVREGRAWLSTIADSLPALVSFVDPEFRYRFLNDAYRVWTGIPTSELVGRHIRDLFGDEAFEASRPSMEQALAGHTVRFEGPVTHPRFGLRQYDSTFTPYIVGDEVRGFFIMGRDVTERAQHEQERERALSIERQTSGRLRNLAEVAARINVAADVDSVLSVIADEGRSLIGSEFAITSLDDRSSSPAIGPDLPEDWLSAPIVGRSGRNLGQIRLSKKIDGEFSLDDQAILLQLARMAAIAIENARLYQELRDKDQRKDEFLAMLAHELRNPLASIGNAVALASRSGHAEDRAFADEVIARQVKTFSRLIDDLLDVSRVSRGKIQIRPVHLNLNPVLTNAVETVNPLIQDRQHTLKVSLPEEGLPVLGDPTRLEQVIVNLLTNAAKYTRSGGTIRLKAERQQAEVVVSVRDNGVGISPEMLPKVFDLFTQVDRSLDRAEGGLGIGLTLVKALAVMHGGSVSVSSKGLDQGSEFTLRLPIDRTTAQEQPGQTRKTSFKGNAARVMVVDDNVDSARSLGRLLSLLDYDVKLAHDGHSAVALAESFRPRFIVLDIGLPGLDGYEVARQIRLQQGAEDSTFIALTGYGQQEARQLSKQAGFDHHLVKPVDHKVLLDLMLG